MTDAIKAQFLADCAANGEAWGMRGPDEERPYSVHLFKPNGNHARISCPLSSKEVAEYWITDWKGVSETSAKDDLRIYHMDKEV